VVEGDRVQGFQSIRDGTEHATRLLILGSCSVRPKREEKGNKEAMCRRTHMVRPVYRAAEMIGRWANPTRTNEARERNLDFR
jgi:hypothetical protein